MATPRGIPSIDALSRLPGAQALEARYGRAALVEALRSAADALRAGLRGGDASGDPAKAIVDAASAALARAATPALRPVINATGIVVHTKLGRAPLGAGVAAHVAGIAAAYTNLEFDLDTGQRGHRDSHVEPLLTRLTGAEAATVVNNAAAAALLVLAALAHGREVVISRGELVEIGGGFRVPDVLAQSGARLREVGTTNRTRLSDYSAAVTERTAAILRVHPSNFRMEGFTARPSVEELARLGRQLGCPIIEDLGSGYLGVPGGVDALRDEPDVRRSLAAGVAVTIFSGDKLLGGPQAGIVAGNAASLAIIRRHPLMRALRVGRLTLGALEATLLAHASGRTEDLPVARMLGLTQAEIGARAERLAARLQAGGLTVSVEDGESAVGGGSAPGTVLPTRVVVLDLPSMSADALAAALRRQDPPVIARIRQDRVVLDLRTVLPDQDGVLAAAIARAIAPR
jgi:L-seryl-tRNA(Ser) seleniumtransferase